MRPSGSPKAADKNMDATSPMLDDIMYRIKAFMLLYMARPCATASTIVAKLSSARTISEASLATSVPDTTKAKSKIPSFELLICSC